MRRRGVSVSSGSGVDEDQSTMLDMIRNSLDCETGAKTVANGATIESLPGAEELSNALFHAKDYWSLKRAAEAEEYLRDVVYGGMDGLAYVRSLAEFVTTYWSEVCAYVVNHRSFSYNHVAIYRTLPRIIEPPPYLACLLLSGLNVKLSGL